MNRLVLFSITIICISLPIQAMIHIEPMVGYQFMGMNQGYGITEGSTNEEWKVELNGPAFGLRLGFDSIPVVYFGGEVIVSLPKWSATNAPVSHFHPDTMVSNMVSAGAFVAAKAPKIPLRISLGYHFIHSITIQNIQGGGEDSAYIGNGFSFGLGYDLFSFGPAAVTLNATYFSQVFHKFENLGGSGKGEISFPALVGESFPLLYFEKATSHRLLIYVSVPISI